MHTITILGCDRQLKIASIKELRAATGLGLKEAKDIIDAVAEGARPQVEVNYYPTDGHLIWSTSSDVTAVEQSLAILRSFADDEALGRSRDLANRLGLPNAADLLR